MKAPHLLGMVLATLSVANVWAENQDEISSRLTGENSYEITLKSKTAYDVATATERLLPTAEGLCRDRNVKLGRYRFETSESLTEENSEDSFSIVQNVQCVTSPPPAEPASRVPQLADERAVSEVRRLVRELSEDYFEKRYAYLGSDASTALNSGNANANGKPPNREKTASGTSIEINLYRITVYDNPQGAPSKGVYVAVDYDNRVGNIAHHCGYLMWHSPDALEFKVGRIESGTLEESLLAKIAPENVPKTLKALRCHNFYDK